MVSVSRTLKCYPQTQLFLKKNTLIIPITINLASSVLPSGAPTGKLSMTVSTLSVTRR